VRAWVRYTGVANCLVSGAGGAGAGKAIGPMAKAATSRARLAETTRLGAVGTDRAGGGDRAGMGAGSGGALWTCWPTARQGRAGLLDRPRRGRPPKLDADDLDWLQQALERSPQDYGLRVTVWSIRELQALVQRERGVEVSVYTLHRVVQALGYRYRRPRHDLRHRQDAEAVAAAKQVLDWLEKN
jgi:transposase